MSNFPSLNERVMHDVSMESMLGQLPQFEFRWKYRVVHDASMK